MRFITWEEKTLLWQSTTQKTPFMTIINTLSYVFAISTLTPMKVVPLISMQVTWLQILNFTCKCGASDLNNI